MIGEPQADLDPVGTAAPEADWPGSRMPAKAGAESAHRVRVNPNIGETSFAPRLHTGILAALEMEQG